MTIVSEETLSKWRTAQGEQGNSNQPWESAYTELLDKYMRLAFKYNELADKYIQILEERE